MLNSTDRTTASFKNNESKHKGSHIQNTRDGKVKWT
jgi:hypothetical protein